VHRLRLGTRKSPLALWQAEHVRAQLMQRHPGLQVELITMTTEGDRILDRSLAKVGGKGLFIKELEQGLAAAQIDLAVHSLKDVTVTLPDGMHLPAFLEREDPRDAFVSARYNRLQDLGPGARVGTSSLRRQSQLRAAFPHLEIVTLRGNVNTRLRKLDEGEFDAVILAVAGLKRLGFGERIRTPLAPEECLPAVGQGVVCVECRADDAETTRLVAALDDSSARTCVAAERAMNEALEGGCQVPVAGYAVLNGKELHLRGLVGEPDGSRVVHGEVRGPAKDARSLGLALAQDLLARGARQILDRVYGRS